LDHELLDDAVESRALVGKRLASFANTLLAGTESTEVLSCLGDNVVVELKGDSSFSFLANVDVEEDSTALLGFCHGCVGKVEV